MTDLNTDGLSEITIIFKRQKRQVEVRHLVSFLQRYQAAYAFVLNAMECSGPNKNIGVDGDIDIDVAVQRVVKSLESRYNVYPKAKNPLKESLNSGENSELSVLELCDGSKCIKVLGVQILIAIPLLLFPADVNGGDSQNKESLRQNQPIIMDMDINGCVNYLLESFSKEEVENRKKRGDR